MPLNYLILIGAIDVLRLLYHRVLIPDAVAGELRDPEAPLPVAEWVSRWMTLRVAQKPPAARHPRQARPVSVRLPADLIEELLEDWRRQRRPARP